MSTPAGEQVLTPAPVTSSLEERAWWVVDADGQILGRLAAQVAHVLRGKHKASFATNHDVGDFVIVINASKIRLTGNKLNQKIWYRHSGFPGGLKAVGYDKLLGERADVAVEKAIKGMLPHNRLGRAQGRKLKVYNGAEHPHGAQQPQPLALKVRAKAGRSSTSSAEKG